jgi:hypothetical protein
MSDPFAQQISNIEKIQAQCAEAGLDDFGWDDAARTDVLAGRMPQFPPRGRPLIEVPGAPRLSSYAEFENLKAKVNQQRGEAQTGGGVVKEAEKRMGEIIGKAAEVVEMLLPLAAEADALYHVVAPARLAAGRYAGTPIVNSSGVLRENVQGPTVGMRAKAGIGPEDLVSIVLGSVDPFELEEAPGPRHTFVETRRRNDPDEPRERVSDVLKEAAARQQAAQARQLGITRQVRLVPGVAIPQQPDEGDDGSGGEPERPQDDEAS